MGYERENIRNMDGYISGEQPRAAGVTPEATCVEAPVPVRVPRLYAVPAREICSAVRNPGLPVWRARVDTLCGRYLRCSLLCRDQTNPGVGHSHRPRRDGRPRAGSGYETHRKAGGHRRRHRPSGIGRGDECALESTLRRERQRPPHVRWCGGATGQRRCAGQLSAGVESDQAESVDGAAGGIT